MVVVKSIKPFVKSTSLIDTRDVEADMTKDTSI